MPQLLLERERDETPPLLVRPARHKDIEENTQVWIPVGSYVDEVGKRWSVYLLQAEGGPPARKAPTAGASLPWR
jgi:hypothetical protein